MSGGLAIRRAHASDGALIHAFVCELAEYEKLRHEVDASAETLARALFCEAPRVYCDIAEWDGKPAGFALWFYNFSTFRGQHGIYLEDLFVMPEFRGKGIGRALLVHLAKLAVAEGYARFEWSVLDWNTPSIDFYKSLGAVAMDEWTGFRVTGDALARLAEA